MSRQDPGSRRLELALEDYLLLAAIVLLPWAFGGVELWASRPAAFLLVSAASVSLWKHGWRGWGLASAARWLLPAFLLAAWAAFQIVPLPPPVLRTLSPAAHELYVKAFPGYDGGPVDDPLKALEQQALERAPDAAAWPAAEGGLEGLVIPTPDCLRRQWRTLSVEPSATQERLGWYLALLLGFLVLRERVSDRERFRAYRWVLFGVCAALAAFALFQMQFWNGRIYWVRRILVPANPFGPYVNPTNLAGVMELAVPALAAFAWSRLRRRGSAALSEPGFGIASAMTAFCLVAGLMAASKMAAAMIAAGLLVLGVLGARNTRDRLVVTGAFALVAAASAVALAGTRLGQRFELFVERTHGLFLLEGRLVVWQSAGDMLRDYLWTGAGFGTFREVFQAYAPGGARSRWAHAHNDFLEILLDGGLVAGVLVLWLSWGYTRRVIAAFRARWSLSRLGLAIGVACLVVHAFVDFNHQIPANALLWLAFCGLLLPARYDGRRGRSES